MTRFYRSFSFKLAPCGSVDVLDQLKRENWFKKSDKTSCFIKTFGNTLLKASIYNAL